MKKTKAASSALDAFLSGSPSDEAIRKAASDIDDASPRVSKAGTHRAPRDMPAVELTGEQLLDGLNPEQRAAVLHDEGPCLVAAIAGSGKTKAVVHRIAYLCRERGIAEDNILAVTFSKKAGEEMNTRLRALGIRRARVGTWHSLCLHIMKEERPQLLDEWEIDKHNRFKSIVKSDVLGFRAMDWKTADLGEVIRFIDLCKCNLAEAGTDEAADMAKKFHRERPCAQRNPELLFKAYDLAQEELARRRLLTFSDMIVGAWKCFLDSETRERWASQWRYVIQDEAQDMNHAQETIGELLARDHRNYMLVGDPGQSIYGFRGSLPKRFIAFRDEWSAPTISMRRNYRSGRAIIAAANGVIGCMDPSTHLGDTMICERDTESHVSTSTHPTVDEEAAEIVSRLKDLGSDDGVSWSDMTCLYRTNAQSRSIEEELLSARIPFVVIGGTNFYDRREVKNILAYLRVAARRCTYDDVKKSMQNPFRYIAARFFEEFECDAPPGQCDWAAVSRHFVDNPRGYRMTGRVRTRVLEWAHVIEAVASSKERSDTYAAAGAESLTEEALQGIRRHMPAAILERIVRDTDYIRYLTSDEGSESIENNRVSNVRELIRVAARFTTIDALLDYIDETIKASKAAAGDKTANRVELMSVHRSKGLEWPIVFVAGASEKIFPHGRADDIEEERRLFYVACTRARDYLHVSSVLTAPFGGRLMDLDTSRFIREAGMKVAS